MCFAGYCLLLLHNRARFGDAMFLQREPSIDGDWVECESTRSKTSSRNPAKQLLPLAGLSTGLSGAPWAEAWLEARKAYGLRAGPGNPTMPSPSVAGWSANPLSASEATVWLREILTGASMTKEAVASVGTHSLRVTLLSWCAKAGISLGHRRLLGQHIKAGACSVITYSRDALAQPLEELRQVVLKARSGVFRPDETRSGRWYNDEANPGGCAIAPHMGLG